MCVQEGKRGEQVGIWLTKDAALVHVRGGQVGFARPILHGLCTLGMSVKAVVDWAGTGRDAGGAPGGRLAVRSAKARFTKHVTPGDVLRVRMWRERQQQQQQRQEEGEVVLFEVVRADPERPGRDVVVIGGAAVEFGAGRQGTSSSASLGLSRL